MVKIAALALLLLPCAALADCAREYERMSLAYKAYNECSAAGRGAAGCASESAAYDSARTELDACHERRRGSSEPSSIRDREDDRPDREARPAVSRPAHGPAGRFSR